MPKQMEIVIKTTVDIPEGYELVTDRSIPKQKTWKYFVSNNKSWSPVSWIDCDTTQTSTDYYIRPISISIPVGYEPVTDRSIPKQKDWKYFDTFVKDWRVVTWIEGDNVQRPSDDYIRPIKKTHPPLPRFYELVPKEYKGAIEKDWMFAYYADKGWELTAAAGDLYQAQRLVQIGEAFYCRPVKSPMFPEVTLSPVGFLTCPHCMKGIVYGAAKK